MRVILDIGGSLAITISACTVILYTLLGGLYSVAYTDVIQMVFITFSLASPVHFFGSFLSKGKNPALLFSMSETKNNFLDLQFPFRKTCFLKNITIFVSLCTLCISHSAHTSHWPCWVNTKRSAQKWSLQNLSRTILNGERSVYRKYQLTWITDSWSWWCHEPGTCRFRVRKGEGLE